MSTERPFNITLTTIKICGLLAIPIVLLVLPANFFDTGESICLSKVLAGVECYACGLTRATMHFIHFDFETAIQYNMLVLPVVPLLMYVWGGWLFGAFKQVKKYYAK